MTHGASAYRLLEGSGLVIRHDGEALRFAPGTPARRPAAAGAGSGEELPLAA